MKREGEARPKGKRKRGGVKKRAGKQGAKKGRSGRGKGRSGKGSKSKGNKSRGRKRKARRRGSGVPVESKDEDEEGEEDADEDADDEEEDEEEEEEEVPKGALVESHKRRWRMRRAKWRIWDQRKNMMRDAHLKIVKHLSQTFRVVVIPRFGASKMVGKPKFSEAGEVLVRGRNISKRTVKGMLAWGHYEFRQRLLQKAEATDGFTVIEVTEPWTSRTCSACGILAPKSMSKIFQCCNKECGMTCDRDLNAAKNIYLL